MRILIVSNLYPDSRQPAFGTFVAAHAGALRRAGADVAVVAISGVPVHEAVIRKYLSLMIRAITYAVWARIRHEAPSVVEAHVAYPTALMAWITARLAGASVVVYCHGSDVTGVAARSRVHNFVARWLFARADLVVPNSAYIRNLLEAQYAVPPAKLSLLPPGVDLTLFSGASSRRRVGEILYVGRLARGKGVHELLQAVVGLGDRKVSLRFVGDGPERSALQQTAAAARIETTFHGAMAPAEVAGLMRVASVVAMPSTHPEGLGLVALEAMAAGALVVATAAGGIAESVIDGETGWLVPPGDVPALSAALRKALMTAAAADQAPRVAMQERAMAKAREHDIDAIARRTLAVYGSLGTR